MEQDDNRNQYEMNFESKRKNNNTKEYLIILIFILLIAGIIGICFIKIDDIKDLFNEMFVDYDSNDYDDDYDYFDEYDEQNQLDDYIYYKQIDECLECYIEQNHIEKADMEIAKNFFNDYLVEMEDFRISNAEYYGGVFRMEYVTHMYEDGTYDYIYVKTSDFEIYSVATILADERFDKDNVEYEKYYVKTEDYRLNIIYFAEEQEYIAHEVTDVEITNLLNYLISIDTSELSYLYDSKTYVLTTKTYGDDSIEYRFNDVNDNYNYVALRCENLKHWKVYGSSKVNNLGNGGHVTFDGIYYNLNYDLILDDNQYLKAKEIVGNKYD